MKVYDIHECMFQKLHLVGSKHREIGKGSAGKNITMTKIENGKKRRLWESNPRPHG